MCLVRRLGHTRLQGEAGQPAGRLLGSLTAKFGDCLTGTFDSVIILLRFKLAALSAGKKPD